MTNGNVNSYFTSVNNAKCRFGLTDVNINMRNVSLMVSKGNRNRDLTDVNENSEMLFFLILTNKSLNMQQATCRTNMGK